MARSTHAGGEPGESIAVGAAPRSWRFKLSYVLPVVQMVLTDATLRWAGHWQETVGRHDPLGHPAPSDFLTIMNGPVSLVAKLWYRHLDWPLSYFLYIASVGLYWYWIALNIESWRSGRTLFSFRKTTLRLAIDVLLIVIGVLFVGYFRDIHIAFMPWQWKLPSLVLFLFWSLGPLWFGGRDINRCLQRRD